MVTRGFRGLLMLRDRTLEPAGHAATAGVSTRHGRSKAARGEPGDARRAASVRSRSRCAGTALVRVVLRGLQAALFQPVSHFMNDEERKLAHPPLLFGSEGLVERLPG